ncbi:MAG: metallophosphoesterase [Boseongicola sp. SB0662_bin_57]|nr:metallophosphoesterase [Boseongicola sp. SB0662_bin_57]
MVLSLVHISDFHYRNTFPSKNRLTSLKDDILESTHTRPFYLVFSGDLVHSGDKNNYETLFDDFFVPLAECARGIFLTPGNHDIQWRDTNPKLCNSLLKDHELSYLYDDSGALSLVNPFLPKDPLYNYFVLQETLSSQIESNFFGSISIEPDFSLISMNSTWLSYERSDGTTDQGLLRIDPPVFQYFINLIPKNKIAIFVTHHPLDWLDIKSRQLLEDQLTKNFDLALFGHNHVQSSISGNFNAGTCLFLHSPAIHSAPEEGPNAYAIVNIDPTERKYEVVYRAYASHLNTFVPGVNLAKNGVRYPTAEDENFWRKVRTHTSPGLLERFTDEPNFNFSEWYDTHLISKNKSQHRLIEPRVSRVSLDGTELTHAHPQRLCAALSPGVNRQFVVGPQDSGLTSAAFMFLKHVAGAIDSYTAIPFYVNISTLKVNKASIIREAAKMSLVRYSQREIEILANDGAALFIIDEIGLPDEKTVNSLIDVLDRHFPECASVFFCTVDGGLLRNASGDELPVSPRSDIIFELVQFDVEEIRELIKSQRPDASELEQQRVLARVVSSFRQMNEPVFPSVVSLLVETLRQSPEFRPINRTRLIDRYVECLLGRLSWEDVEEGTFNSNDKVTFLAYIAGRLAIAGWSMIPMKKWEGMCLEYAEDRLLELPDGLLDEFSQKGIVIQQGEWITFRADYLFAYFVAKEMNVNQDVYRFIVEGEGFFRNYRELVVYGELEGVDNLRLLDDTHAKLDRLEESILKAYAEEGVDLEDEWREALGEGRKDDQQRRDDAMGDANSQEPSRESVNRALSGDLRSVERSRGVFKRFTVQELEARWLVALRTYCQLVKHCGGLSGADKLRHFQRCAASAELFIKHLSARREEIRGNVIYYHGGIVYVNPLAIVDSDKAHREFKLYAPHSVAEMFAEYLNNAQMMPVYRRVAREGSEVEKFLSRHLLLETPTAKNRVSFVESLINSDELTLQTSSLRQVKYKYMGYSISPEEQSYFRGIIDDLSKKGGLVEVSEKQRLGKRRLLADFKARSSRRKVDGNPQDLEGK